MWRKKKNTTTLYVVKKNHKQIYVKENMRFLKNPEHIFFDEGIAGQIVKKKKLKKTLMTIGKSRYEALRSAHSLSSRLNAAQNRSANDARST